MRTLTRLALFPLLAFLLSPHDVFAQRRGGGGMRGGGGGMRVGGGVRGGGMPGGMNPSMGRAPSFSMPRQMPSRPSGMGGGGMPQARPRPSPRPSTPSVGGGNRPQIGGGNRPQLGGGDRPQIGGGNRPGGLPGGGFNPGSGTRPGIATRPGTGERPNIGDRPGLATRPGLGERPNIGDRTNIANRPRVDNRPININTGNINRGTINQPIVGNRPGGWNGAYPGGGYWGSGGHRDAYWAYHRGWHNGYWHGFNDANVWRNWTTGAFWGLTAWGLGSAFYNWGFASYVNPYYVAPTVIQQPVVVQQPVAVPVYDYSQPINTEAPPPEATATDTAVATFDQARDVFKKGDYTQALRLTDQALKTLPNDAVLHEFRALNLFALKKYDEAAATLYAVLSVGPGWDWTTLSSLYPDLETYTAQLRALEEYRNAHPDSAAAHFVLAYHYLTAGHDDAAVKELQQVVKLQPNDQLSAQLLKQYSGQAAGGAPSAETPPPSAPAQPTVTGSSPKEEDLVGTWQASPSQSQTITLKLEKTGQFSWTVDDKGTPHTIQGQSTYGNGVLTLAPGSGPPMVGQVSSQGPNRMRFQLLGAGSDGPSLTFSR